MDGDTIVSLATSDFHEPSKTPLKSGEINLSISYITYSALWVPRYDLSLNSVKCTGILEYGAELRNIPSETWKDAKVILSTSQTSFSGLSESIPALQPWHVRLLKGGGQAQAGLFSENELQAKAKEWDQTNVRASQKQRTDIYGKDTVAHAAYAKQKTSKVAKANAFEAEAQRYNITPNGNALLGNSGPNNLFGGAGAGVLKSFAPAMSHALADYGGAQYMRASRKSAPPTGGLFSSSGPPHEESEDEDEEGVVDDYGYELGQEAPQSIIFEEGAWEESGMTTTYEVPAPKTLSPSHSLGKHKIAKIEFKSIVFSHIVIGKLRQVAFLKARLRNASKITLLRGPLGLTLDGSFLGQTTFPRCSSGEGFSLPLGMDPGVGVAYTKPTVRRSQTGIFNKEGTSVFTRTIVLTNTKLNKAAELTVKDQVPVSEDERLKIEIVQPRGLRVGGEAVKTGVVGHAAAVIPGKGAAKDVRANVYASSSGGGEGDKKWGTAVASAKKGGEVVWNVKLNPGQSVKLVLEYEASFPAGEAIVGAQGKGEAYSFGA